MPYHGSTGYRHTDTSLDAARKADETAGNYRERTAQALDIYGPLTADEIAQALNVSILTIRPRVTELRRAQRIEPTGLRRKTAAGKNAIVWRLSSPPECPRTFAPVVTAGMRGTSPPAIPPLAGGLS
jgi:hypothetical protein